MILKLVIDTKLFKLKAVYEFSKHVSITIQRKLGFLL